MDPCAAPPSCARPGARPDRPPPTRRRSARAPAWASCLAAPCAAPAASSGAYVVNADTGKAVFRYRHTPAADPGVEHQALHHRRGAGPVRRGGPAGHRGARRRASSSEDGTYRGNLYLVGGGDPTFGSRRFARRSYGGGGTVEALAALLEQRRHRARDRPRLRRRVARSTRAAAGPSRAYGISPYVGPLSGLAYNRGLASESGRGYQSNPPAFAAARLDARAGAARHLGAGARPRAGKAPGGRRACWPPSQSPTMARLAALTNKPSDNFFAEMLVKDLAAAGRRTRHHRGRRAAGGRRSPGGSAAGPAGWPTARASRAPTAPRPTAWPSCCWPCASATSSTPFFASLSIAGRDGTLRPADARRRRRAAAAAARRARSASVSAVSGYCRARSGETYVFSILMNGVNPFGARAIQDRMLQRDRRASR